MAGELLLDTGALVSLLDRSQKHHREFLAFFDTWRGPIVSTEAILTEATYLLGRTPGGVSGCLSFFTRGAAILVPTGRSALVRCNQLIERYADLPMDYADATLVVLAEELDTELVLTTDRRDFSVYRIAGKRGFTMLPDLAVFP